MTEPGTTFWYIENVDYDQDNYTRYAPNFDYGLFTTEEAVAAKVEELHKPLREEWERERAAEDKKMKKRQARWDALKAHNLQEGPRPKHWDGRATEWRPGLSANSHVYWYSYSDVQVTE